MKAIGWAALVVVMAGPALACSATKAEFDRIRMGASYANVVEIIGCPGEEMARSDLVGFTTVLVQWAGRGGLGANMNVMFQNGLAVSKAQFGLN